MARIADLERLDVDGTKITDEGMKHLKGLANLKSLELNYTRVTDAGVLQLRELNKLTELQILTETGISHEGMKRKRTAFPTTDIEAVVLDDE